MRNLRRALAFLLIIFSSTPLKAEQQQQIEGGNLTLIQKFEAWTEKNPDLWRGIQGSIDNLGGGKPQEEAVLRALEAIGAGLGEKGLEKLKELAAEKEATERAATEKAAAEKAAADKAAEKAAADKAAADRLAAERAAAEKSAAEDRRREREMEQIREKHATKEQIKKEKDDLGSAW